jgi:hypothetical protein
MIIRDNAQGLDPGPEGEGFSQRSERPRGASGASLLVNLAVNSDLLGFLFEL